MKKTILVIVVFATICLGYCYKSVQRNKKLIFDFAYEMVNVSIPINNVVSKHIECDKIGKGISLILISNFRKEYNKNPKKIYVYTYCEGLLNGFGKEIESPNKSQIYFVEFNDSLVIPILLNNESKVVAFSYGLKKGNENYLLRIDGIKEYKKQEAE
nr:hypothetical protein [uncultured Flavobacterium sp.]